ncbi:MAG: ABC transporter substrate-binding protein [Castellaniella sp.]|nr:ABC transporter substrate-binding protein [Castellaniella sp.]
MNHPISRRHFLTAATAAIGATTLPLAFSRSALAADSPLPVIYGGSAWLGHYPAYVGMKDGGFKRAGFDFKWESFGTSSSRMTALMAGNIDIAGTGVVSAIALMARGARQFQIIGIPENFGRVEGLFVHDSVKSLADLKGKTIGTTFASSSHLLVLDLLASHGLTPDKDVSIVNVGAPEIPAALKAKQIDACATWTPYFNTIKAMLGMKLLHDDTSFSLYKKYGVTPGPDILVVRTAFEKTHPGTLKRFLTAYFGACVQLRDKPDDCAKVLTELTKLSEPEQAKTVRDADWYDLAQQKELLSPTGKFVTGLQALADMLVTYKQIDKAPKVSDWITPEFV